MKYRLFAALAALVLAVAVPRQAAADDDCRVCLYDDRDLKGAKKCFDRDITNLKDYDFNDKADSVVFDKTGAGQ